MKRLMKLVILMLILCCIFLNTAVYGENICNVDIRIEPKAEEIEDDIEVLVSIKDITKKITSISFLLEYDTDILEIENIENCQGWSSFTQTENFFMLYRSDYESIETDSSVVKIKLKLKDTATLESFDIYLKNIRIVDEEATETELQNIKETIKIKAQDETSLDYRQEDKKNGYNQIKSIYFYIILLFIAVLFIGLIIKIVNNN